MNADTTGSRRTRRRFAHAALLIAALGGCVPAAERASSDDPATAQEQQRAAARARILFSNAESFFFMGRYAEAIQEYTRVIEIAPRHAEAWRCRAAACAALGREADAHADYARAIELAPGDDEVWLGRGLWHFARGRYADAVDDFDRAIALDPRRATPFLYKARACERIGRLREASEARAAYIHCSARVEEAADPGEHPPARELTALGLE